MIRRLLKFFSWLALLQCYGCLAALPPGFVYVDTVIPNLEQDLRYLGSNNFVGRPIAGYYRNRCILTQSAAQALAKAQHLLKQQGYRLVVYDCYRPTKAVEDFYQWSQGPSITNKAIFFPRQRKSLLFSQGFIAKQSGHSRGSTVDLSIYRTPVAPSSTELACYAADRRQEPNSIDMGTNYDCMDKRSHAYNRQIDTEALKHRKRLRRAMTQAGFRPYLQEWWHFTLQHEPYPQRYFDFDVK